MIVTWPIGKFDRRCRRFGTTLADSVACIVETHEGGMVTLDTGHDAFPRPRSDADSPIPSGPGTELKAALAGWPWRIKSNGKCLCDPMAAKMDKMGCDWCLLEGHQEILDTMKAEAKKRKLPWVKMLAELAIRRAVSRARRKVQSK